MPLAIQRLCSGASSCLVFLSRSHGHTGVAAIGKPVHPHCTAILACAKVSKCSSVLSQRVWLAFSLCYGVSGCVDAHDASPAWGHHTDAVPLAAEVGDEFINLTPDLGALCLSWLSVSVRSAPLISNGCHTHGAWKSTCSHSTGCHNSTGEAANSAKSAHILTDSALHRPSRYFQPRSLADPSDRSEADLAVLHNTKQSWAEDLLTTPSCRLSWDDHCPQS
mmetsp:Transcript_28390/g.65831  ORF Transcript_28390/g.65831 Transcript_28390/m.65831 type:complete len:221 (-) Transcript_28390:347-1009(-)